MQRLAVVARLKPEAAARAAELIASGPPFDPKAVGFQRHSVYLSSGEVVFVFEGEEVEWMIDDLVDSPFRSPAFEAWRPLLAEPPRPAREAYFWTAAKTESGGSPHPADEMKKILIAIDGSAAAREAAKVGLELAAEEEATAVFVHVVAPPDWKIARLGPAAAPLLQTGDEDDVLLEAAKLADEKGVPFALEQVTSEAPADAIAEIADTIGADLLITGSRGLGAVAGALLGSVSRGLIRNARCPVLIVRGGRAPDGTA